MGVFDQYNDTPFQIKAEGQLITLKFAQGVPTNGQGTVSWNIPTSGADCVLADERSGAYAGILIVASNKPLTSENIPVDGTIYDADPTVDVDLHAGDTIGDALVVGAFYEAQQKAQGEQLTTSLVLNNLKPNTPYYIAAYAVDAQYRYHTEGVRAYSDELAGETTKSQPAVQYVRIGDGTVNVMPSDGTGLVPSTTYEFDLFYNDQHPNCETGRVFNIKVNGADAGTYQDLLDELNRQLMLVDNPPQSPTAPGTGTLYWKNDTQQLFQFNGTTLELVPNVIVESSDPSNVDAGEYWYDTTKGSLFIRSSSPSTWEAVNVINFGKVDPRDIECTDYWFNGTQGYIWNGTIWCVSTTIISSENPACPPKNLCGAYWFNQSGLYGWNQETSNWDEKSAIAWPHAPNALTNGTFWFDLEENKLYQWNGDSFVLLNVLISTTQPSTPAADAYWFNPTSEELKQYVANEWVELDVLVWPGDPTNITSCDLWWDTVTDELFVWDTINSEWTQVALFIQSDVDPTLPPTVDPGTIWYNPDTNTITRWDGASWMPVDVIVHSTDPTKPSAGDAWFNVEDNNWYIWDIPSLGTWNQIDPIESSVDPTLIPNGVYWFNPSTNALSVRNGLTWVTATYVTTPPFPVKGQKWFNTSNNTLYKWTGSNWVIAKALITASVEGSCNRSNVLAFVTEAKGSNVAVKVLIPGNMSEYPDGYAMFGHEDIGTGDLHLPTPPAGLPRKVQFPLTEVTEEDFLFNNLVQGSQVLPQTYGTDGVSPTPSYLELGIGTDGTPDERRMLADMVRRSLGYPVVDVELTQENLDDCIKYALSQFRTRSSLAYKRGFFFLDIKPGIQKYRLTNRAAGYHKIVSVTDVSRFTSAFLSSAHGAGVYGQVVMQHLYNMGTYDLTSFHLVAQYIEQLEHLFATRLTFHWDEPTRQLHLYNSFTRPERVLMDCFVERTEQELIKDRWSSNWIREWAKAEAMVMLAHIRGKYGSLPGAGGGVTLNASELRDEANTIKERLLQEIDDYVVQDVEDVGLGGQFTIG